MLRMKCSAVNVCCGGFKWCSVCNLIFRAVCIYRLCRFIVVDVKDIWCVVYHLRYLLELIHEADIVVRLATSHTRISLHLLHTEIILLLLCIVLCVIKTVWEAIYLQNYSNELYVNPAEIRLFCACRFTSVWKTQLCYGLLNWILWILFFSFVKKRNLWKACNCIWTNEV